MSLMIERFVTTGFGSSKPALNSQKCYRNHITQFEIFLKARQKTAGDGTVTDQDILDYTEQLHSKYQPNTVAARMGAIKSYFRWLQKQGLTCHPTIRSQKITLPIHKELDSSALKVVLEQLTGDNLATKRDLAGFSLVIYCGFKTREAVALNVENIDFKNAMIVLENRKCSFRAAFKEMKAYSYAKSREDFHSTGVEQDEKEPFFLNKHHSRISTRSFRRRIMSSLSDSYNMRDLQHTYRQNHLKLKQELAQIVP